VTSVPALSLPGVAALFLGMLVLIPVFMNRAKGRLQT
jgi:hypothetical protein